MNLAPFNRGAINLGRPVNPSHPLNKGLVAWWLSLPSRTGGSRWLDLTGSNHGTLTGGATWQPPTRPGGLGQALLGESASATAFPTTGPPLTVAGWFRVDASGNYTFCTHHSPATNNGWQVAAQNFGFDGAIRFTFGSVESYDFPHAVAMSVGRWNYFAVTVTGNGGTATAYWTAEPGGPLFTSSLSVGTMAGTPSQFDLGLTGPLDDIAVWSRCLSGAEVLERYNLSRLGYPGVLNRLAPPYLAMAIAAATTSTLAAQGQPAVVAFAATVTPPAITGTLAEVAAAATVALAGTNTPPAITSTLAEVAAAATVAFASTNTPPAITSTLAEVGQAAIVALASTNTPPATTGDLAESADTATVTLAATNTAPGASPPIAASLARAAVNLANPVDSLHPLNRGLAAWWLSLPSRTGGPRWLDLLGQVHGTLSAGVGWAATARPRGYGELRFGGADGVNLSDSLLVGATAVTIAFWYRPTSVATSAGHRIVGKWGPDASDQGVIVGHDDSDGAKLIFAVSDASGAVNFTIRTVGGAFADGVAVHVACTWAGSGVATVYLDGAAAGAATSNLGTQPTAIPATTSPLYIGRNQDSENGLIGAFDDLQLFTRALTPEEILQRYNAGRRGYAGLLNRLPPLRAGSPGSGTLCTLGEAGAAATVAFAGTNTPPAITGDLAEVAAAATVTFAGTNTPPAITGDLAEVAATGTVAFASTNTPPAITSTLAEAGQAATVVFAGTNTPPAITSTLAEVAAAAVVAFVGTNTPPATTGDLAEAGQAATVAFVGTNTPPAVTGDLAEAGVAATVTLASTNTPPAITGTLAEVADAATESYTAVSTLGTVATLAAVGQPATVALDATNTPPAVTGTLAEAAAAGSVAFVGVNTPPAVTGTLAEAATTATVALVATNTAPAIAGTLAEVAASGTVAFIGTSTPPAITGTLAEASTTATVALAATGAAPTAITATLAAAGAGAIAALAATYTPPAIVAALNEVAASATVAFAQAGVGVTLFTSTGALRRVDPVQSTGRVRDIDPGQTTGTQR